MNNGSVPTIKDLVLIGGGHGHITVLRRFGMKPMPGIRLTLICRDVHTPYSGMLPGFIAGLYNFDDIHIDLALLCRFANARFFNSEVIGLDLSSNLIICDNRPPVVFDQLSLNIGSAPRTSDTLGAAKNTIPVKPINRFLDGWCELVYRSTCQQGPITIAVVGAGAGGVELILAMQSQLQKLREQAGVRGEIDYHLFGSAQDILPGHNKKVASTFKKILSQRNINLHSDDRVVEVGQGVLRSNRGKKVPVDEVLWVTAAGAPDWLGKSGLEVDDEGFVKVLDTFQSKSHPSVFAVGDIACVEKYPRPKSGVFAVRQGKPLEKNLRRALLGLKLISYIPQKRCLSIITAGKKYAVASRGRWSIKGRAVWHWKDWIDRKFMRKYQSFPKMQFKEKVNLTQGLAEPNIYKDLSALAMRCGGCGAKIGASVLERVIGNLKPISRHDVLIGLHAPDDAAVVNIERGKAIVHTIDSFRAMLDDPYIFGKIAANHSLGDIFAMGGDPQTALTIATIPYGIESKIEDTLTHMMTGALEVLNTAGAALVGGHTSEGAELSLGFSINGLIDRDRVMRKGGLEVGDILLLTKPIGTGALFAANMRGRAKGHWINSALEVMTQSNYEAAKCVLEHEVHACTDVTGFGLLGHLVEMIQASNVDVTLNLDAIPVLLGAEETVQAGIFSSLQPQNLRVSRAIFNLRDAIRTPKYSLVFDPQTAGGLLVGIKANRAEGCIQALKELGYVETAIIGNVLSRSDKLEPITIQK